jgi:hypothetical protein
MRRGRKSSLSDASALYKDQMVVKQITAVIVLVFLATAALAQTNRDGDRMEGQVSFGFDAQDYNTGRTSRVGSIDATVRLLPRWTLETVATGGVYFGERFGGGAAYVALKPDAKTYITAGGGRNSHTGTTVAWSASIEAGRTLYQSERSAIRRSAIRALEADFNLTERGYSLSPSINILLVNPTLVVYLPRDWSLTLRAGAVRTTIAGASTWTPSGGAKLNVPLTRRLSISPGVAFDSEPSDVLQINNISSRGFGAGARFWLTRRTSTGAYYFRVFYGANHLANDSYGVSYALRF